MYDNLSEEVRKILSDLENLPEHCTFKSAASALQQRVTLSDFGKIMIAMPMTEYPKLSRVFPAMAPDEVQVGWTGNSGIELLTQSLKFVESVALRYQEITAQPLKSCNILDFGCGYGRLARLMYYFTAPENVFGVDPWKRSIALCRQDGLGENFRHSENLPESLPLPDIKFQLIYAFSVFTHLSPNATFKTLAACRRYIAKDGLLPVLLTVDYAPPAFSSNSAGLI